MKELQKFQNSTFDEFTKQKFIEDQKITISPKIITVLTRYRPIVLELI